MAQARLSHTVCDIPYDKLTAEILKLPSSDAANKICLESVKTKLSPSVYEGYKAEKIKRQTADDTFVSTKTTIFAKDIKTECEGKCTVGTEVQKTECKKSCET